MKGRIEKMPSVTNARVANVQKKSLDRNAWKKAINAGSCRAASTVTTPLATKTAAMGQSQAPSGARRIANRAMSATRKAAIQIMTPSRIVAQLHEEVGGDEGELTRGQRQQPEADDVQDRPGHHPGPAASPPRHGSVAQPPDDDGCQQRKDTAGGRHSSDQEIGIPAGDEGGADRNEGDIDRLPVGAAAEPERIDRSQPAEAQSRRRRSSKRGGGHSLFFRIPRG